MNWNKYKGGKGWRQSKDSLIIYADAAPHPEARVSSAEPVEGSFYYRTRGEPLSMRQLLRDYGPLIEEAAVAFDIAPSYIMACIGIEATRLERDRLRFDPRCIRLEPGYRSDEATPNKVSPGLMQTLLSTAGDMVDRCTWLDDGPFLTREDLFSPRYSISLGTAYMRHQMDRLEPDEEGFDPEDPILNVVAAYNAGSVRFTAGNAWHLETYSDHRIDRFIAWHNDALDVLGSQRC